MEEIYISMKDASKLEEAVYKTFLKQVSQRVKKRGWLSEQRNLKREAKSENTSNLLT